MAHILIIDDDEILAGLFEDYLEGEKFTVEVAHTGQSGLEAALTDAFDLVVLDVMLPDMQGTEVLKRIREQSHVPILMFTAKGDDVDRILGLEAGADDYVPKPCTPRELIARIKAILRRTELQQPTTLERVIINGPLELWPQKRKALWFNAPLELTSTEFSLLEALAKQAGQVVTKKCLIRISFGQTFSAF